MQVGCHADRLTCGVCLDQAARAARIFFQERHGYPAFASSELPVELEVRRRDVAQGGLSLALEALNFRPQRFPSLVEVSFRLLQTLNRSSSFPAAC
jgi:hypothetical protein